jgi:CRISPR-associated endonuclease Csy4
MSDHYIDIQLRTDPEIPPHQVMAELYGRLHLRLAAMRSTDIGVSFPGYRRSPAQLGSVLRVIGSASALSNLLGSNGAWLGAVGELVQIQAVQPVPATARYRTLRRVQAKSSPARLRRRQMKRHGLSETEALTQVPDSAAEYLTLPFIQLRSASTGQNFRLFLALGEEQEDSRSGQFNSYGLSPNNTLPWF